MQLEQCLAFLDISNGTQFTSILGSFLLGSIFTLFALFALFALRNPVELTLRQKKFLIILLAFLFFLFAYFSLNFISGDI